MNSFVCLTVFTANILGFFSDPFEFEGDYGQEVNSIRKFVFEQVVAKEALVSHSYHSRKDLISAIQQDLEHGPTLNELVTPDLIQQLIEKQKELELQGFTDIDLHHFLTFIYHYGDYKIFSFMRHCPSTFLTLGKTLQDKAVYEGRDFNIPILGSTTILQGNNSSELKQNLLNSLFTKDILESLQEKKTVLDPVMDMSIFTSPAGQVFFYWLYESLNLHLTAQDSHMISEINKVKRVFKETLGNPQVRAQRFREELIAANASVVFTQESDIIVPSILCGDGLFHSAHTQNANDGTLVFLRADIWEPDYQIITIDDYPGYRKGRLNVILATLRASGEKLLLASCHGHSTRAEDGRLQITKVVEKFNEFKESSENKDLQLVIGIDANTKSEKDIEDLREHLSALGLEGTSVGPTTVKRRMVTLQHSKAARYAIDEEDYIIVLKAENGGLYQMTRPTVGFKEEKPDLSQMLPNIDNLSDHYPVGATLERLKSKR